MFLQNSSLMVGGMKKNPFLLLIPSFILQRLYSTALGLYSTTMGVYSNTQRLATDRPTCGRNWQRLSTWILSLLASSFTSFSVVFFPSIRHTDLPVNMNVIPGSDKPNIIFSNLGEKLWWKGKIGKKWGKKEIKINKGKNYDKIWYLGG